MENALSRIGRKKIGSAVALITLLFSLGVLFIIASRSPFLSHHPSLDLFRPRSGDTGRDSRIQTAPHRYADSSKPISNVSVTAVYFIPSDGSTDVSTIAFIDTALRNLKLFHEIQFGGASRLEYTLLPVPVAGAAQHSFYEIEDMPSLGVLEKTTEKLNRISDELEARGLIQKRNDATYPVELIVYEGIGLGGGVAVTLTEYALGGAIVPRQLLTDPQYFYGGAVLAHEFYHALGVPDAYDVNSPHATASSNDIMGAGRYRSLELGYLSADTLTQMGVQ